MFIPVTPSRQPDAPVVPYHGEYMLLYHQCLAAGYSTVDAREYAQDEINKVHAKAQEVERVAETQRDAQARRLRQRIASGELTVIDFTGETPMTNMTVAEAMTHIDHALEAVEASQSESRSDVDSARVDLSPLLPNPPSAPVKIDRRRASLYRPSREPYASSRAEAAPSQPATIKAADKPTDQTAIPSFIRIPSKHKHRKLLEARWQTVSHGSSCPLPRWERQPRPLVLGTRRPRSDAELKAAPCLPVVIDVGVVHSEDRISEQDRAERARDLTDQWPGTISSID